MRPLNHAAGPVRIWKPLAATRYVWFLSDSPVRKRRGWMRLGREPDEAACALLVDRRRHHEHRIVEMADELFEGSPIVVVTRLGTHARVSTPPGSSLLLRRVEFPQMSAGVWAWLRWGTWSGSSQWGGVQCGVPLVIRQVQPRFGCSRWW